MASADDNKESIEKIVKEVQALNIKVDRKKLPGRQPTIYTYGQVGSFLDHAKVVENYLKNVSVQGDADRIHTLLTFLDAKSFSLTTRVFTVDQLKSKDFQTAVNLINNVLSSKMSETTAMKKLANFRQRKLDILDYIGRIEILAGRAFHTNDSKMKEKAMAACLVNNSSSSHLKFELAKFSKKDDSTKRSWSEICLRAVELSNLLTKDSGSDSEGEFVLEVAEAKPGPAAPKSKEDIRFWSCSGPHYKRHSPSAGENEHRQDFSHRKNRNPITYSDRSQYLGNPRENWAEIGQNCGYINSSNFTGRSYDEGNDDREFGSDREDYDDGMDYEEGEGEQEAFYEPDF